MTYAIAFFSALCVVKAVGCTYKIACYTADSFKFYALSESILFCCVIHYYSPFKYWAERFGILG